MFKTHGSYCFFIILAFVLVHGIALAQTTVLQLTFSAIEEDAYLELDSITVRNLSEGVDTVLVFPDTVLQVDLISRVGYRGTDPSQELTLSQNVPNPFDVETAFDLTLQKPQAVLVQVQDVSGRTCASWEGPLTTGSHRYIFQADKSCAYFITVRSPSNTSTIKALSKTSGSTGAVSLLYEGSISNTSKYKREHALESFVIDAGDELLLVGHRDGLESGMILVADSSQQVLFQFATNIPCPGLPSFTYGGQEYSTIQVRSQCWMKENMNFETANSSCIYNNPNNCDTYGRLYLWEATQEVCPEGWHLPSDNEWKILEGVADSQYGILDTVWDYPGNWRGLDAGTNIKSTSGWYDNGNGLDLYGFTAPPGGYQLFVGTYGGASIEIGYWTSTEEGPNHAWERFLHFSKGGVHRHTFDKGWGLYVRCVRD